MVPTVLTVFKNLPDSMVITNLARTYVLTTHNLSPRSQSYIVSNVSWPMLQFLVFFRLKIHIRSNLSDERPIQKIIQYLSKFP